MTKLSMIHELSTENGEFKSLRGRISETVDKADLFRLQKEVPVFSWPLPYVPTGRLQVEAGLDLSAGAKTAIGGTYTLQDNHIAISADVSSVAGFKATGHAQGGVAIGGPIQSGEAALNGALSFDCTAQARANMVLNLPATEEPSITTTPLEFSVGGALTFKGKVLAALEGMVDGEIGHWEFANRKLGEWKGAKFALSATYKPSGPECAVEMTDRGTFEWDLPGLDERNATLVIPGVQVNGPADMTSEEAHMGAEVVGDRRGGVLEMRRIPLTAADWQRREVFAARRAHFARWWRVEKEPELRAGFVKLSELDRIKEAYRIWWVDANQENDAARQNADLIALQALIEGRTARFHTLWPECEPRIKEGLAKRGESDRLAEVKQLYLDWFLDPLVGSEPIEEWAPPVEEAPRPVLGRVRPYGDRRTRFIPIESHR